MQSLRNAIFLLAFAFLFSAGRIELFADDDLNDDLLKELDDDLLEGLEGLPDLGGKNPAEDSGEEPADDTGPEPIGKSVGESQNPLLKLSEMMQQARRKIEQDQTADETQKLQREIVVEMESLIAALKEQSQQSSGGGKPPEESNSDSNQNSNNQKSSGQGNAETQATNPSESTDRVGGSDDPEVERKEIETLLGRIWGELPDRVRKQMQDAAAEKVLPRYEKIIEEYYKRLAEERRLRP